MIVNILQASMTASDSKTQAGTNSPEKGGGILIDQHGTMLKYEPGENWYDNHEDVVRAGEKEALLELKNAGYKSNIRGPKSEGGAPPSPPAEWDHLVVTTTREETEILNGHEQEVMDALMEALHKTVHGRRMLAISYAHDDTGNLHWHINLHRFAVDHEAKTISTSMDLTKNSILHQTLARINEVMRERGLIELSDFIARDGRAMSADRGTPQAVHDAVKKTMQEAGAVDLKEPLSSLSRNLVSPDLARIANAETTVKHELANIELEIHKLREKANIKATGLTDLQSAKAAIMQRDQAIQEKQLAEAARDEALEDQVKLRKRAEKAELVQDELTAKVLSLTGQVDELQLKIEDLDLANEEKDDSINELRHQLDGAVANVKVVEEELSKEQSIRAAWEKATKEEIEAHSQTATERDMLEEQVKLLDKAFAEQSHATQVQIDNLREQFKQQALQAENFITRLSEQNNNAQAQIESLTKQLQEQSKEFSKQLTDQANQFANQLEKALSVKSQSQKKTHKSVKVAGSKSIKPVVQETETNSEQSRNALRKSVNAQIKASLDSKKKQTLNETTDKGSSTSKEDIEKDE